MPRRRKNKNKIQKSVKTVVLESNATNITSEKENVKTSKETTIYGKKIENSEELKESTIPVHIKKNSSSTDKINADPSKEEKHNNTEFTPSSKKHETSTIKSYSQQQFSKTVIADAKNKVVLESDATNIIFENKTGKTIDKTTIYDENIVSSKPKDRTIPVYTSNTSSPIDVMKHPPEELDTSTIKSNSKQLITETKYPPRQVDYSNYFETRRSTEFYINSYFITILTNHYGIVVFGQEYYLSGEGINVIKPGTWNDMEAKKENGRNYFTNKSEEEFHEFLRQHIFDPKNYDSNFDSEFFTKLVNDFLTLDDVTRSINYLKAVAAAGGRKSSSITSNLYINYYNYMNFWYHTGIVVYGKEYYFCIDGVLQIKPGTWNGQKPIYRKNHCQTQVSMDDFEWDFVKQTLFKPEAYSTFNHNCNTFTELAYEFLTHERPQTTVNYLKAKSTAAANLVNSGNYYLQKLASTALGGGSTSKDGAMAGGSVGTAAVLGGSVGANTRVGAMRGAALGATSYMATALGAGAITYGSVPESHEEEDTSLVVSHSRKDRATEEFEQVVSAVTDIFNFFTKN